MNYGHWNVGLVGEFDPADFFGFIYLIVNHDTSQAYIGKKFFRRKITRQKNKRKRRVQVASDWETYSSSCVPLQQDIATLGEDHFSFIILRLCSGKSELTYMEEAFQYRADVLTARLPDGSRAFYNNTISHKHFAGVAKQCAETHAKYAVLMKGRQPSYPSSLPVAAYNVVQLALPVWNGKLPL